MWKPLFLCLLFVQGLCALELPGTAKGLECAFKNYSEVLKHRGYLLLIGNVVFVEEVQKVILGVSCPQEEVTEAQAAALLREFAREICSIINEERAARPYLAHFPWTDRDCLILLSFRKRPGMRFGRHSVETAQMADGEITCWSPDACFREILYR